MDKKIKWRLKEIRRGIVKIEVDQLSKIPSIEDYKEYIAELLGIREDKGKLLDESFSPNIAENQLLYHEENIRRVIFSGQNGDISVGINNFNEIFEELKANKNDFKQGIKEENFESIQAAVEELWTIG